MLMALEETFQTTLDERMLAEARTISDLDTMVRAEGPKVRGSEGEAGKPQDSSPTPHA